MYSTVWPETYFILVFVNSKYYVQWKSDPEPVIVDSENNLLHFQQWFTEIYQFYRVNYFISNVLTSSLLGDVAAVVGNNKNNTWRFAENLIKPWKSDCNFHV